MSNYQEFEGSWKLPKKEVNKFRKQMVQAHNDYREKVIALAERHLKEGVPIADLADSRNGSWNPYDYELSDSIENTVRKAKERVAKPTKITESDYPKANTKTQSFGDYNGRVTFHGDTIYFSADGNRVDDRMGNSYAYQGLIKGLNQVEWKNGTGGVMRYCDEYTKDAAMHGGGDAISLSCVYGPMGEQEEIWKNGWSPARQERIRNLSSHRIPVGKRLCGKMMPRKRALCTLKAGHKGGCKHTF